MNVYTMKMVGVSMISTCTLSLRIRIVQRWMAIQGFVLALFLLLITGAFYWAPLVFPLLELLISVHILLANYRRFEGESNLQPQSHIDCSRILCLEIVGALLPLTLFSSASEITEPGGGVVHCLRSVL